MTDTAQGEWSYPPMDADEWEFTTEELQEAITEALRLMNDPDSEPTSSTEPPRQRRTPVNDDEWRETLRKLSNHVLLLMREGTLHHLEEATQADDAEMAAMLRADLEGIDWERNRRQRTR